MNGERLPDLLLNACQRVMQMIEASRYATTATARSIVGKKSDTAGNRRVSARRLNPATRKAKDPTFRDTQKSGRNDGTADIATQQK